MAPLARNPRFPEEGNKKYPKHLLYFPPQAMPKMADKGFYMFNYERSHGKLAFLLFLVVLLVIAFMLFNIWPLWLKIGIWYVSFYLLVVLVAFILFRAFVWFFFFLFGFDLWVFPNFFNDNVGFLESF